MFSPFRFDVDGEAAGDCFAALDQRERSGEGEASGVARRLGFVESAGVEEIESDDRFVSGGGEDVGDNAVGREADVEDCLIVDEDGGDFFEIVHFAVALDDEVGEGVCFPQAVGDDFGDFVCRVGGELPEIALLDVGVEVEEDDEDDGKDGEDDGKGDDRHAKVGFSDLYGISALQHGCSRVLDSVCAAISLSRKSGERKVVA